MWLNDCPTILLISFSCQFLVWRFSSFLGATIDGYISHRHFKVRTISALHWSSLGHTPILMSCMLKIRWSILYWDAQQLFNSYLTLFNPCLLLSFGFGINWRVWFDSTIVLIFSLFLSGYLTFVLIARIALWHQPLTKSTILFSDVWWVFMDYIRNITVEVGNQLSFRRLWRESGRPHHLSWLIIFTSMRLFWIVGSGITVVQWVGVIVVNAYRGGAPLKAYYSIMSVVFLIF